MDFNAYQSIFTDPRLGKDQMSKQQCKQAWLRGLGDAKKEPFKKQVWVEKLGKYEVREHLWIEMPAVMGGSLTKDKCLGWIVAGPGPRLDKSDIQIPARQCQAGQAKCINRSIIIHLLILHVCVPFALCTGLDSLTH